MLISDDYLQQNRILHEQRPTYGAGADRWADAVTQLLRQLHTTDLLDYGCGKGRLGEALRAAVTEYDPAIPGKDTPPKEEHDVVACLDVLEHIEPDCLDDVLAHLHSLARLRLFAVISTRPANKTLPDGRNAHLITKDRDWWQTKLNRWFSLIDTYPCKPDEMAVLLKPKK